MAVRYYLADVIGAGSDNNPFRPATTAVRPKDWSADDGRQLSTSGSGRMLVWMDVTPAEHALIIALSGVTAIPFEDAVGNPLSLDDAISSLGAAKRTALRNALEAAHIDTDDLQLSDPIRLVVRRIKKRLKLRNAILKLLDFTEGLDTTIGSIPAARRQNINNRLTQAGFDTSGIQLTDTIREALRRLWTQNRASLATDQG